jgi:hypothetical protein
MEAIETIEKDGWTQHYFYSRGSDPVNFQLSC